MTPLPPTLSNLPLSSPTTNSHPSRAGIGRLTLVYGTAGLALALLLGLWSASGAGAQTPSGQLAPGDVSHGLTIFLDRCATCHGAQGDGNGEQAAQAIRPPTALADPTFLQEAVPAAMAEVIRTGRMENGMPPFGEASSNPLSDQDRADVIAAIYALSTTAKDLAAGEAVATANGLSARLAAVDWFNASDAAVAAGLSDTGLAAGETTAAVSFGRMRALNYYIPQVALTGQVINATSGDPVAGLPITLQAFERFSPIQTISGTLSAGGAFTFTLNQVAPDWVYFASVQYAGLDYPSTFVRFGADAPIQNVPLTVYETTTDSSVVNLSQIHLILEFGADTVTVNEFYGFGTSEPLVFLGTTGRPEDGTVSLTLPPDAQNLSVMRSIAGAGNFTPATDLIQNGDTLQEVVSIAPGANTLGLLVRYDLPYEDGMRINHALNYPPGQMSLIMPDAGVRLADSSDWVAEGGQTLQGGTFLSYRSTATTDVDFQLEGRPRLVTDVTGSLQVVRNQSAELLIGAALLIGASVLAVLQVRGWQQPPSHNPDELLNAIAALDDAYANEQVSPKRYAAERQRLKQALLQQWSSHDNRTS